MTPTLQEAERRLRAYCGFGTHEVTFLLSDLPVVLAELDRLRAESQGARVLEEAARVCTVKADCYASYAKQAYRTLADKVAFARDAETLFDAAAAIRALKGGAR
jgi:hypothetical protein